MSSRTGLGELDLAVLAAVGRRRRSSDGAPPFIPIVDLWTSRAVWPVTIQVDCQLPAPMAKRLAAWDLGDGSGLAALAALL